MFDLITYCTETETVEDTLYIKSPIKIQIQMHKTKNKA